MVAYAAANPEKARDANPKVFQCIGLMAAGVQCQLTASGRPAVSLSVTKGDDVIETGRTATGVRRRYGVRTAHLAENSPRTPKDSHYKVVFRESSNMAKRLKVGASGRTANISKRRVITGMKKPYEKPVMILEQFDTGAIFCSDPDSEFYRRFVRVAEEARKNPVVSCEPLCGRTGCMQEAGSVWEA